MCQYHFDQLQSNKEERLNIGNRTRDSIRSRRKSSKFVEAMQDQLARAADQESEYVGPSIAEQPSKPAAWDILDRASVRSKDNGEKKD
jgi:hypothetical protein